MDLDAIHVLRRTLSAYGRCRTYRDCGRVRVCPAASKGRERELFFTTDYSRPDLWRFDVGALAGSQTREVKGETVSERGVLDIATVLWNGERARVWRARFAGEAEWPTTGAALAWAARLDGLATDYIVHLLSGREFEHADEARSQYLGQENLGDVLCHKIEVPSSTGRADYLVWIETETFLMRGLHEQRDHRVNGRWGGGAPARTTFEFHPVLDVPVDENVFRQRTTPGGSRLERYLEVS